MPVEVLARILLTPRGIGLQKGTVYIWINITIFFIRSDFWHSLGVFRCFDPDNFEGILK